MMNELPTIYEVVTGTAKKQLKERSTVPTTAVAKTSQEGRCGHLNLNQKC
jgi:hypothetical protein